MTILALLHMAASVTLYNVGMLVYVYAAKIKKLRYLPASIWTFYIQLFCLSKIDVWVGSNGTYRQTMIGSVKSVPSVSVNSFKHGFFWLQFIALIKLNIQVTIEVHYDSKPYSCFTGLHRINIPFFFIAWYMKQQRRSLYLRFCELLFWLIP